MDYVWLEIQSGEGNKKNLGTKPHLCQAVAVVLSSNRACDLSPGQLGSLLKRKQRHPRDVPFIAFSLWWRQTWQKQPPEERVDLGSQVEGDVKVRGSFVAGAWESGHRMSPAGKQADEY